MRNINFVLVLIVFFCVVVGATAARAQNALPDTPRHDLPPRKVIVGTTMTPWYSDYPGLDARIAEMCGLIDEMAADSIDRYGRPIDVALFAEYALTSGKPGSAMEIAIPVDEKIVDAFGEKARQYNTYIVLNGIFLDDDTSGETSSNAAVVIDRSGKVMGRYAKVHPVLDDGPAGSAPVFEGGIQPGKMYNVFDCDFGRVGIQICYDVEFPEGWQRLGQLGTDLVLFPSQSPQTIRTGGYAATQEYWVVSATFRNNASFFEPGTGLIAAQITGSERVLVEQIDLSYLVLPWSSELRNGQALTDAFGERVG